MTCKCKEKLIEIDTDKNIYLFLLRRYFRNLLLTIDQSVNTIFFGDEDETISSVLGKSQRGDFGIVFKICLFPIAKLVDFIFKYCFNDPNHCFKNIEECVGHNSLLSIYTRYKKEKLKKGISNE